MLPVVKKHFRRQEPHHGLHLAFMIATLMLTLVSYAGYKYLIVAAATTYGGWAWRCAVTKPRHGSVWA